MQTNFRKRRRGRGINLRNSETRRAFSTSFLVVSIPRYLKIWDGFQILSRRGRRAVRHFIYPIPRRGVARQIMVDPNPKIREARRGEARRGRRRNHTLRQRAELIECKEAQARIMRNGCRKTLRVGREKGRPRWWRISPGRFQNGPSQTHINWLRGMNPFTF